MSLICAGTIVGLQSKDWEIDGKRGTAHTLTVSTGDGTEELKIRHEDFMALGTDGVARLRQFGRPVVARCTATARASDYGPAKLALGVTDIQFVKLGDLHLFGYTVEVYDESDDLSLVAG